MVIRRQVEREVQVTHILSVIRVLKALFKKQMSSYEWKQAIKKHGYLG